MRVYLDVVVLLNFLVDFFLLLGTQRLTGYPLRPGRAALGAVIGGVYGGVCLLEGFRFLGNTFWRLVFLGLMGAAAYGISRSALRRCVVFVFLSMALGGIAYGLGSGGFGALVASAAMVCGMCLAGFSGRVGAEEYIPIKLTHRGKTVHLTALRDTGNTLSDPVTGESVLVVSAEVAERLLDMEPERLASPVETVAAGKVPGLRLIPYRAVGQSGGMLLALRIDEVEADGKKGSALVAFAPEGLGGSGEYQALTGGLV